MGKSLPLRAILRGVTRLAKAVVLLLLLAVVALVGWKTWDDRNILHRYTRLPEMNARVLEEGVTPGRQRHQLVELNGFDNEPILFRVLYPPGATTGTPRGCVIMNYGLGQNLKFLDQLASSFVGHDVVLVMPEQYNRGIRREKNRKLWQHALDFRERPARLVAETRRIIDFLESLPPEGDVIDPKRIDYIGVSYGGITGCALLAQEPRLRTAAFVMAGGDIAGILSEMVRQRRPNSRVVWPSLAEVAAWWVSPFEPLRHIGKVPQRSLFFVNVENDELIPKASVRALFDVAPPPKQEKYYPGPHNRPSDATITQMMHDILDWMGYERLNAAVASPAEAEDPASSRLLPVSLRDRTTPER